MGGISIRPPSIPMYLPLRMAFLNWASVQFPMPVSSEVIFAAKEVPHGPIVAVRSLLNTINPFWISFGSAVGIGRLEGNPDNIFRVSISGPCGPIRFGEWQSL